MPVSNNQSNVTASAPILITQYNFGSVSGKSSVNNASTKMNVEGGGEEPKN
jgi:hypothetical protein